LPLSELGEEDRCSEHLMIEIARIIGIALHHKWRLVGAYISMLGALISFVIMPKIFGDAIDSIAEMLETGVYDQTVMLTIVGIILGLGIIRGALSYFQTYLGESLSQMVSFDLRNLLYDHVQHMSFGFHDRHHTGAIMSRAITDVENIRMFINMGLVRTPYFLLLFVAVAAILFVQDWRLGLISASFMPVVMIYSAMIRLKMRNIWLIVQEKMAEMSTVLQENFTGIRVVKAFAAEPHEEAKFERRNQEVATHYIEAEKMRASSTSFMLFTFLLAMGMILFFGGRRVIAGEMSPGELASFIFYLQTLQMPVRMAGWLVNSYARAASAGQRLFEILDTESPVQEEPNARSLQRPRGHVVFEDVTFSYDDTKRVLRNFDLDAKPGQVIALLGAPGSGKSSVVNLIPRFYDVTGGRITIDGNDIRNVSLKSLRQNIGIVQQDVYLFATSIRENIAYGNVEASDDMIEQAAKIAQMHEFIGSLPAGYDTHVGERGATLSGGQRQRMSIARAVLLDPPVLILDDSTSSVDARTEELIRRAMEAVMQGRTTFVIAHRLSTVHRADSIIVMKDGKIAEQGTHQELLQYDGLYREIYDLQLRPQEEVMREIESPVPTVGD
jgi:ATP-binding cassette subfamily B protein